MQLPVFNFSLKKVIDSEPDSFGKSRIKIVLSVLIFSIVKAIIAVLFAVEAMQYRQLIRAAIVVLLFLVLIKILLSRPSRIKIISHIVLLSGIAVIFSNLFLYSEELNVLTVQMVFMITLTGYYLIGGRLAAIYTLFAIAPVVFFMIAQNTGLMAHMLQPQKLQPVGFNIVVLLNFLTFITSQYLYYQAFYQNLQEKETLNGQLKVNIMEAKALAESRSVFLSTMSHELRTPLNGVIGMANILKDNALEEQKEDLNILEFSANNLLSLINDILDYNKIELDKIELEALPVNLYALLQKACFGLESKAFEKGLTWKLQLDAVLKDKQVVTDPMRITQIIYNLAGNAIKFTESGIVEVSAKVIGKTGKLLNVEFSVSDTGIGIAQDRIAAIFDPFTQASTDTTRRFGGTGLGLAIVKRLLRLFNSDIELKSIPGEGSEFKFSIEFLLHQGQITPALPEFRIAKGSMPGLKLLIVEDNRVNVLVLQKILAKWHVQTVAALNGQEAIKEVMANDFNVILMDIHMPVMDGYDATLAIRALDDKDKANIPIIAITASVANNIFEKIKDVGMQDYLSKPFQPDQLYEKLLVIYKTLSEPAL